MSIVLTAQVVGTVSIFLLFCLKFYIAVNPHTTIKTLRVAILWTTIYIFFLFILRLFSLFKLGTMEELRIISGFAATIPLLAVVAHMLIGKKIENDI